MSNKNYDINKLDEALTNGITSAMSVLDSILGSPVSVDCNAGAVECLDEISFSEVEPAMCAAATISGDVSGRGLVFFRASSLSVVISQLTKNDELEFDEMSLGMLNEILSQVAGDFSSSLSLMLEKNIQIELSPLVDSGGVSKTAAMLECEPSADVFFKRFSYEVPELLKSTSYLLFNDEFLSQICEETSASAPIAQNQSYDEPEERQPEPQKVPQRAAAPKQPSEPIAPKPSRFKQSDDILAQSPVFPDFSTSDSEDFGSVVGGNMDLLMDVPVNVCVEIGKTKKRMKEVMNYSQGSVILLDKRVGEPADITINGQIIARGEVIVIENSFGIRITEIVNSKELYNLK